MGQTGYACVNWKLVDAVLLPAPIPAVKYRKLSFLL
jgi:hypothetical protein